MSYFTYGIFKKNDLANYKKYFAIEIEASWSIFLVDWTNVINISFEALHNQKQIILSTKYTPTNAYIVVKYLQNI
uniref:Uncharacterized protein n=1 Tax=Physcomitrium patens TaxID=3218 RepID=A0A2K1KQ22_PHYPA|nr:hypothetical protein PHYPA_006781 [Physcomitrium patens]